MKTIVSVVIRALTLHLVVSLVYGGDLLNGVLKLFDSCYTDLTLFGNYGKDFPSEHPIVISPVITSKAQLSQQWLSVIGAPKLGDQILYRIRQKCLAIILVEPPPVPTGRQATSPASEAVGKYEPVTFSSQRDDPWFMSRQKINLKYVILLHLNRQDFTTVRNSLFFKYNVGFVFHFGEIYSKEQSREGSVSKRFLNGYQAVHNLTISFGIPLDLAKICRQLYREFNQRRIQFWKIRSYLVKSTALPSVPPPSLKAFIGEKHGQRQTQGFYELLVDFLSQNTFQYSIIYGDMHDRKGKSWSASLAVSGDIPIEIIPFDAILTIDQHYFYIFKYLYRVLPSQVTANIKTFLAVDMKVFSFNFVTCSEVHRVISIGVYLEPFNFGVWIALLLTSLILLAAICFFVLKTKRKFNPILFCFGLIMEQGQKIGTIRQMIPRFSVFVASISFLGLILGNAYKGVVVRNLVVPVPVKGITTFEEVVHLNFNILPNMIQVADGTYLNQQQGDPNSGSSFTIRGSEFGIFLQTEVVEGNRTDPSQALLHFLARKLYLPQNFPSTSLFDELLKCNQTVFVDFTENLNGDRFDPKEDSDQVLFQWGTGRFFKHEKWFGIITDSDHDYLTPNIRTLSSSGIFQFWQYAGRWNSLQNYRKRIIKQNPIVRPLSFESNIVASIFSIYAGASLVSVLPFLVEQRKNVYSMVFKLYVGLSVFLKALHFSWNCADVTGNPVMH